MPTNDPIEAALERICDRTHNVQRGTMAAIRADCDLIRTHLKRQAEALKAADALADKLDLCWLDNGHMTRRSELLSDLDDAARTYRTLRKGETQ